MGTESNKIKYFDSYGLAEEVFHHANIAQIVRSLKQSESFFGLKLDKVLVIFQNDQSCF